MVEKPKKPIVDPLHQPFPRAWTLRFEEIMNDQKLVEKAKGNPDYLTALRNQDIAALRVTIDPYNETTQQDYLDAMRLVRGLEAAIHLQEQPPQPGEGK